MIESQAGWGLFPQLPRHFRTDLRLDALLWGCVLAFILAHEPARLRFTRLAVWIPITLFAFLLCTFRGAGMDDSSSPRLGLVRCVGSAHAARVSSGK